MQIIINNQGFFSNSYVENLLKKHILYPYFEQILITHSLINQSLSAILIVSHIQLLQVSTDEYVKAHKIHDNLQNKKLYLYVFFLFFSF